MCLKWLDEPHLCTTLLLSVSTGPTERTEKGKKMSKKYTVSFKIETEENWQSAEALEAELRDIIRAVIAPTFNFELFPLSFTVKKARN